MGNTKVSVCHVQVSVCHPPFQGKGGISFSSDKCLLRSQVLLSAGREEHMGLRYKTGTKGNCVLCILHSSGELL